MGGEGRVDAFELDPPWAGGRSKCPTSLCTAAAALMGGEGRVDAFELDPKRAAHLQRNVDACGASSITVHQVPWSTCTICLWQYVLGLDLEIRPPAAPRGRLRRD